MKPLVERGVIPVITGFIAATEAGVTTTLGRGGSDYTAAIVGAGLNADEVWIWSDVNGILTADPNLVTRARTLRELSYAEAADLAYYGADVLHPKTIRPVIEHTIPLRIMNSFNPEDPGTWIVEAPGAERDHLPAIISTTGLSLIAIGSMDDSWSLNMVARALQALSDVGIDVLMFSQSFSEHSLNLIVRRDAQQRCLKTLRATFNGRRCVAGSRRWGPRNRSRRSRWWGRRVGARPALSPTPSRRWARRGRGSSRWRRPPRSTASPSVSPATRWRRPSVSCTGSWGWRRSGSPGIFVFGPGRGHGRRPAQTPPKSS